MNIDNLPTCVYCGELVLAHEPRSHGTNAVAHWECGCRAVIGGLNHLLGKCSCYGGDLPPDPPELTQRQAALAAVLCWKDAQR